MLLFLYGPDTYRSREKLKKIIGEYKKADPDWLDFNRVDARDKEIEILKQIRQITDTISMFSQKKLIVIENIFLANRETQDEVLEFLKNRNLEKDRDINIVFWAEEIDKRLSLFKFLKSKVESKEFNLLKDSQLKNWIRNYVEEQKGDIDNKAIDKLVEYVGKDLWRIANEINKLISFKMQDTRNKIQVEDVELLVKPEIDLNIFHLVDALGDRNKSRVLKLFKEFLEKGQDENYLLSMFVYQIRNLLKIKFGGGKDLHPFVFRKAQQQARSFDFDQLKKIYHQLLAIDLDIKTGRTDSKTALELFLAQL